MSEEEEQAFVAHAMLHNGYVTPTKVLDAARGIYRVTITVGNDTRSVDMTRELLDVFVGRVRK